MTSVFALQTVDVVVERRVDLFAASLACQPRAAFQAFHHADTRYIH